jgi:hypothetical protein
MRPNAHPAVGIFLLGETRVFDSLKKLFGKKTDQSAPEPHPFGRPDGEKVPAASPAGGTSFLRREAVFDRRTGFPATCFAFGNRSLLADGEMAFNATSTGFCSTR